MGNPRFHLICNIERNKHRRLMAAPVEQPRDTDGPAGTTGCACVSRDARECAGLRYSSTNVHERCTCLCHEWPGEDGELTEQG